MKATKSAATLALLLALTACGSSADDGSDDTAASTSPTTSTAAPSTKVPATMEEKCNVPLKGEVVPVPVGDNTLMAGVLGEGEDGVVLLHQNVMAGSCGWGPYGEWLAGRGVNVVMLDLCGYGGVRCDAELAKDWTSQVKGGIDLARSRGAKQVTVVGASLGGVVAMGVGQKAGADAIVDLSGPVEWENVPDLMTAAKETTVPLLISSAPGDVGIDTTKLQAAVKASPAKEKRFVEMPGDAHGWGAIFDGQIVEPTFAPLATTVLHWIQGKYTA